MIDFDAAYDIAKKHKRNYPNSPYFLGINTFPDWFSKANMFASGMMVSGLFNAAKGIGINTFSQDENYWYCQHCYWVKMFK